MGIKNSSVFAHWGLWEEQGWICLVWWIPNDVRWLLLLSWLCVFRLCSSVRCPSMAGEGSAGVSTPSQAGPSPSHTWYGETPTAASTSGLRRWIPLPFPRYSTAWNHPERKRLKLSTVSVTWGSCTLSVFLMSESAVLLSLFWETGSSFVFDESGEWHFT